MSEAATATALGEYASLPLPSPRPAPIRRDRPDRGSAPPAPAPPAAEPGADGWLVVLDGAAGADLAAVVEQIAVSGAEPVPLHGILGRSQYADEAQHQARWLTQDAVARGLGKPVLVLGDWVGGLATAAALAARDGGRLLAARAAWALDCLSSGLIRPADMYAVVDLNPADSLMRMGALGVPGDPWRDGVVVEQLRAFWLSPAAALRGYPALSRVLRSLRIRRLDGRLPAAELAQALCQEGPQGFLPQGLRPRPAATRL